MLKIILSARAMLFPVVVALLAAGCAVSTPYQPSGLTGGYTDKKLDDGRYWLRYVGNGFTKRITVWEYWEKRASELCEGRPYKRVGATGTYDERNNLIFAGGGVYANQTRHPVVEGIVECQS